jgi:hypothetical protein
MHSEYTIAKLKEQKQKVNNLDFEVWLKTTYSYLVDDFGISSTRALNFNSLISDFSIKKIFGLKQQEIEKLKKIAIEYIDDTIQYLEEKGSQSKQFNISIKKNKMNDEIKDEYKAIVFPAPPLTTLKEKTRLPFGLSAALFWTIFVSLIAGSFTLGLSTGTIKYDKDKIELYNEKNKLIFDTINFNRIIVTKDSIIKIKDSVLNSKIDSLYFYKNVNHTNPAH